MAKETDNQTIFDALSSNSQDSAKNNGDSSHEAGRNESAVLHSEYEAQKKKNELDHHDKKFRLDLEQRQQQFQLEHTQRKEESNQLIQLRQGVQSKLFALLTAQVIFLGVLILLQGTALWGFKLEEWAFAIFINGSLIHTYMLVKQITVNLFPSDKKKAVD